MAYDSIWIGRKYMNMYNNYDNIITTINEEETREHNSNGANVGVPFQLGPAARDPERVYERNKQGCCEDIIHVEVHTLPEEMIGSRTPPCDCAKE